MPELAEVETVRRALDALVVGRLVLDASSDGNPRFTAATEAVGHTIRGITRRGKNLVFDFGAFLMRINLGMTGALTVHAPGQAPQRRRALWHFDGLDMVLGDVRGFGRVDTHLPGKLDLGLGPEPIEGFDLEAFAAALTKPGPPVKARLLNQDLAAGVGNYLADETLWLARVSPFERVPTLDQSRRVGASLVDLVALAIERGGYSMRDYVHPDGSKGTMSQVLECYGRVGQPCHRCTALLVKERLAGRGTTYCPTCQPLNAPVS